MTENRKAVNTEPSGQCCGAAHGHSSCLPTACEGILTTQQHLQRKSKAIQTAGGSITNTEQKKKKLFRLRKNSRCLEIHKKRAVPFLRGPAT